MRTKVGYAGGKKEKPTYEKIGDHSETIQIEFDPEVISYEELVKKFFELHNPTMKAYSKQYMSAIFYHDEQQKNTAIMLRDAMENERKIDIVTDITPYTNFYLAELYHQKYYLQGISEAMQLLKKTFPTPQEFLDAPIVTKINGEVAHTRNLEELMDKVKVMVLDK